MDELRTGLCCVVSDHVWIYYGLKRDVEAGRHKLEVALGKAARIPVPGELPRFSQEERLGQVQEAIRRQGTSPVVKEDFGIVNIRLVETPTILLFELAPKGYAKGSKEAEKITLINENFLESTCSRADTERRRDAFTQSPRAHYYREKFQTESIILKDKECSASNWEMYDALKELENNEKNVSNNCTNEKGTNAANGDSGMRESFLKAAQTVCRVLASNTFAKEQVKFCAKHQPCRKVSYKMEHLWTLSGEKLGPVNKISLNPFNPRVMGVGYGGREGPGAALVWHLKNPEAPERQVTTERAVTCLHFSSSQPRLLAAVTRAGAVIIADISLQPPLVTQVNKDEEPPFPEPLWSVCWTMHSDGVDETERLLTIGQAGQLCLWDPINKKEAKMLGELNLTTAPDPELKLRCRQVLGEEDESTRHFFQVPYIGLSISLSPIDKSAVYITTDIGPVIKVQSSRIVEGLGWHKLPGGHKMPVLGLHHSPFLPKVYLTHSADGTVAVWVHGFHSHLLQLATSDLPLLGVESAQWSPSHSTILASLQDEEVCLWDIARRTDRPVSRISGRGYTSLTFSSHGANLLIGRNDGKVLVYRLSEMPHRPYMQREHLEKALRKAMENNPELLRGFNTYVKS